MGRKTAERLVLELREKLQDLAEPVTETAAEPTPSGELTGVAADVFSALLNLGYTRAAAESAVREARKEQPQSDLETLLRSSLRLLARKFFS